MALPTLDATFASSADLPRKQMLVKWLVEELGETQAPSDVLVSSMDEYLGTNPNGVYSYVGDENGKPKYEKDIEQVVLWEENEWRIFSAGDALFVSTEDVAYPWLVQSWQASNAGGPPPIITEIPQPSPLSNYYSLPEHYLWAKIAVAAGGPKTEADYISLPKNYAWSDIYNAVSGDIANSTVVVSGLNDSQYNGSYVYDGDVNGRPSYRLNLSTSIYWAGGGEWVIEGEANATSGSNVIYPWLATGWVDEGIDPTNLVLTPQTPNHTDWTEKQALGHIAAAYRGDTGNPANLATYIDWPWRYKVASIIGAIGNGAGNWTPSQITTSIWLDASDASTVSVSSGILTWNDKSGNDHHFTATSSTNSPTYSGTRNGLNVINFDSESNAQFLKNLTYTNTGSELHLFSAHINTPTSGASAYGRLFSMYKQIIDYDNVDSIVFGYAQPFEDPDGIMFYRNGSTICESSPVSGEWCIVDGQRNGTNCKIALNAETYITGSTEADNFDIMKTSIGSSADNIGDTGLTGYVAEQIVLSYIPTQSVVEKIQGYLAHKWGLAGSLPSSHPYKNTAPTI